MSKSTSSNDVRLNQAIQLHMKGDLKGAETAYRHVLTQDQRNYTALANLGALYLMTGHWQEASDQLSTALRINPSNPEVHYKLGTAFHQQGKLEQAIVSYQQALILQPNFPEVLSNLGVAFKTQGDLEEAIIAY